MSIDLNHTIVHARDHKASATFLADILGRAAPVPFGPFYDVELDNGATLDTFSLTLSNGYSVGGTLADGFVDLG